MPTKWLFNCFRMIWNATAPALLRVPGPVRELRWSPRYRRAACVAIMRVLQSRPLTTSQLDTLATMRARASAAWLVPSP